MAVKVIFACGCFGSISEGRSGNKPPSCLQHDEHRISRVMVRPPSFVGVAVGPHVRTEALAPATPSLCEAGAGRLSLKPQEPTDGR